MPPVNPSARGNRRKRMSVAALGLLMALLVVPAIALHRLASGIDWRVLVAVPLAGSLYSFFSYRSDKRRAEAGEWRIPESTLHLADLLGGWPGGFLAQRIFRHKTAKQSFQSVFWVVVLIHEFVAVDSLLGWRFTLRLIRFIESYVA